MDPVSVMPDAIDFEGDEGQGTGEGEVSVEGEGEGQEKIVIVDDEGDGDGGEKPAAAGEDLGKEVAKLRQQLYEAGLEIQKMQRGDKSVEDTAARAAASATEGDEITDQQLEGIIEKHKDNPQVLLRVYKHIATNEAKKIALGIRDETVKDVEYKNWHRELQGHNDSVMQPLYQTNPELKSVIQDSVKRLGLEGHPFGEVLVHSLRTYASQEKGKAKEAAEAERVDKLKKVKGLDETRKSGDKGSKKVSLTPEQKEAADALGVRYENYAKFVTKEGD